MLLVFKAGIGKFVKKLLRKNKTHFKNSPISM